MDKKRLLINGAIGLIIVIVFVLVMLLQSDSKDQIQSDFDPRTGYEMYNDPALKPEGEARDVFVTVFKGGEVYQRLPDEWYFQLRGDIARYFRDNNKPYGSIVIDEGSVKDTTDEKGFTFTFTPLDNPSERYEVYAEVSTTGVDLPITIKAL